MVNDFRRDNSREKKVILKNDCFLKYTKTLKENNSITSKLFFLLKLLHPNTSFVFLIWSKNKNKNLSTTLVSFFTSLFSLILGKLIYY